ncbi:MAG: FAD-binding oxidoreductase [Anaerolineales bacterium]|jgi:D-lactate dehydrogenase (cytochrome)
MTLPYPIHRALVELVGERGVSVEGSTLSDYSHDESSCAPVLPLAVVKPEAADQVAAVLALADRFQLPVTARGAGSSLEGNAVPCAHGIVLSLERMNHVLEVMPEDFQARVQPGVVYDELNRRLGRQGLFFAPGPSSGDVATLGGMVGNNAGGLNALRYGVTRDNILRLQVALAKGSLIWAGTRALKSSSGYDLVRLFVGSEGTLGIATEMVVRLHAIPEHLTAWANFRSAEVAAGAVFEIMRSGIVPGALELLDPESIRAVNAAVGLHWLELPMLLMEFHGTPTAIQEEGQLARSVCQEAGCTSFQFAANSEERDQLWAGRKGVTGAQRALYPGCAFVKSDVAVPLSQYANAVRQAHLLAERFEMKLMAFGHAGDGNLHTSMPILPDDTQALSRGEALVEGMINFALSVGGTATAEHGIGLTKRRFLESEHGAAVDTMRAIKEALDPNGILNPGKIFQEKSLPA